MGGFNFELETGVAPPRMFKASVLDAHKLLPKIMPEQVSNITVHGDGGVGSFKEYKFTGALPYTHVKERVDVLDKDNLVYKFTLVEGGQLGEKLASAVYHAQFVPSSRGGCIVKVSAEITPISGAGYSEEEANVGKDGMMGMFKGVESFLLANPSAYA